MVSSVKTLHKIILIAAFSALPGVHLAATPAMAQAAQEKIDFEADQITYDADTGEVRALGRVRLVRDGYTLEAGEIRYNEKTGDVEAFGAVELTSPEGNVIYAPKVRLEDTLKRAFIEDIRLVLKDGSQVAAKRATRDADKGITTLERAIYSPCKVCADKPEQKPLWQIKAVKVVHDQNSRRLKYKNAYLELMGVPVLWLPRFSHPDPSVERASGLLALGLKSSKELGLVASLPYYHVFSQSRDLTLTPILTTQEGPVLAAEYRQHVGAGQFTINGSATYADELAAANTDNDNKVFRGHISSQGRFDHSKKWQSSYQLNWASDDTYLRRYDFSNADTLMSDYKLEGFFGQSYASARTMAFQGLRVEDISGLTAFALPLIDAEYISNYKPFGGTFSMQANALSLYRTDGLDTQRLSASARWQRRWITPKGFIADVDALVRSDAYNISDADQPDDPAFGGTGGSTWRTLARMTGSLSWPLVKFNGNSTHTLEPLLEVTLSPASGATPSLVNEDSRAFELNSLNLFSSERTAGYDLWEEGSRVTYGLKWRYEGQNFTSDIMVGQSARLTGVNQFSDGMGLEGDFSDFVGHTLVTYKDWLDIEHNYRLDDKDFAFRRNEVKVKLGAKKQGIRLSYLNLDRSLNFINREDREEIRASGYYQISKDWRVDAFATQDLTKGIIRNEYRDGWEGIEYGGGVTYSNECIEFSLSARKTFTEDRDVIPGTSVMFRLKLKNLG